jgi:hypothetical protein
MQTVTVDRNTQHLAFLAGELQAAKRDFNRAQADVNTPADVLESLYVEMNIAEDDFRFEFQAVAVLQEMAAPDAVKADAAPVEPYPDRPGVEGYNNQSSCLNHALNTAARMKAERATVNASRVRCGHWKAIKRAFAIARENGLDTSKVGKARMRHTMEDVLGKCVDSRGQYSGSDWMRFGDAIKAGARW